MWLKKIINTVDGTIVSKIQTKFSIGRAYQHENRHPFNL